MLFGPGSIRPPIAVLSLGVVDDQPRIDYLPVRDPNILANINTPEDYNALLSD